MGNLHIEARQLECQGCGEVTEFSRAKHKWPDPGDLICPHCKNEEPFAEATRFHVELAEEL